MRDMAERRRSPRTEVDQTAYISAAGSSTRCRVLNVSEAGAAIEIPQGSYIPEQFQLMTETDRVIRNCRIVWIMKDRIGIEFVSADSERVKSSALIA